MSKPDLAKKNNSKNQTGNLALYTKYRPQKFSDVIGQEQIINVLENSLKLENISHAYLFSGSRGTGKTSVARILANEIGTSENDLFEIDAASNNGVEEIRRLTESVQTMPFDSKYKVYILDEVHMLSKSAFNALLKTLEEPPKHIIFVLATTEPEKLPETVISRCEHYQFKSPNRTILKKMIIATAKKEGYELDSGAGELLAILGDGSFRDAHTNLQKLIRSSADAKISVDEVEKVMGAPQSEMINNLIKSILEKNQDLGLSTIATAKEKNIDIKIFLKLLIEKIRAILILKIAKEKKDLYEDILSDDDIKSISELLITNSQNLNSKTLLAVLDIYDQSINSPIPYLPLELMIVDLQ
ncbi:MAG TPA: DNA polymerase III subunit gamma/tau [Candidatus Paceibacterota bacterium]|nr:DNA polymerase III subunit gamma/tau [Candidatus Paceibacterota bacterium]